MNRTQTTLIALATTTAIISAITLSSTIGQMHNDITKANKKITALQRSQKALTSLDNMTTQSQAQRFASIEKALGCKGTAKPQCPKVSHSPTIDTQQFAYLSELEALSRDVESLRADLASTATLAAKHCHQFQVSNTINGQEWWNDDKICGVVGEWPEGLG